MTTSKLVKVQKMGAFLSASVMPNIGVFIGWGILAALFIPKGWIPNETLGSMVAPTIKYLIPLLIGYTGGTVAPISPGSFFALLAVSPKDSIIVNVISYVAGAVVALLVAGFFLKVTNAKEEDTEVTVVAQAHITRQGNVNAQIDAAIDCPMVCRVVFACDAGMGSSVMGESIMKTKLTKAMLQIEVVHCAVAKIKENIKQGDLIITSKPLAARVKNELEADALDVLVFAVDNLLNAKAYDEIIGAIKGHDDGKRTYDKGDDSPASTVR